MSISALASASIVPVSQPGVSFAATLVGTEEIVIDDEIPAGSVALSINIGVADTTKLKGFMFTNTGTADITSLTLDAGTVDLPLKAGESMFISGASAAKKLANAWSGATTMLLLKATTPAGPAKAFLKGIVIADT
jgi:hypothetical protein